MGLFSSRKSSVKKEAKFAEPPAAAPAPAAVAATSSDDLSLQKTEGFRRGSALATKQDLEAATLADFDVVRVLGRGAFGKVSLVQHKTSHEKYALKTLNKKMLVAVKQSKGAITEREVLKQKGHPCIVRLYWAFQDDESLHMVLDYLPGGDLYDRIEELREAAPGTGFPVARARLYAAEIALGVGHLHDAHGVIYRDLKPENVLVDAEGHARLTDFGLARVAAPGEAARGKSFCGTAEYMAPEVVQRGKEGHDKAVDWWGLGVMLWEMLHGSTPFDDENHAKVQKKIVEDAIEVPAATDAAAAALLTKLLVRDPAARLGAGPSGTADIKAMDFWQPLSWDKVYERAYPAEWIPPEAGAAPEPDDDDDDDSDDDEWHMHVPGAMGGKPDSKPDLFRGFTFRREASFVGPPETAKRGSKEQLTRTASRMKRQESKLK